MNSSQGGEERGRNQEMVCERGLCRWCWRVPCVHWPARHTELPFKYWLKFLAGTFLRLFALTITEAGCSVSSVQLNRFEVLAQILTCQSILPCWTVCSRDRPVPEGSHIDHCGLSDCSPVGLNPLELRSLSWNVLTTVLPTAKAAV